MAMANVQEPTDYTIEGNRLTSFKHPNWKPAAAETISVEAFTEAGLYYIGKNDIVKCAWCPVEFPSRKAVEQQPMIEHYRNWPTCPFVIQVQLSKQSKWVDEINLQSLQQGLQKDLDWQKYVKNSDAVKIVKEMGYDYDTIMQAVNSISVNRNVDMNTTNLLDEIFKLEGQANNDQEMEENEENLQSFKTVMQRSKMLKSKTKNEIVKEAIEGLLSVGKSVTLPKILCTIAVISYHQLVLLPQQTELYELKNENYELKNENCTLKKINRDCTCKVCLENQVEYIFMPCCHLVCCDKCGQRMKQCPVCRVVIAAKHKTFMC